MQRLLCLATALACGVCGCDILNPDTRSAESQLEYVNTARQYTQAIQRWWPWIAPKRSAGAAFGELPFALPSTFPISISALSSGYQTPPPNAVYCDVTCSVTWISKPDSSRYQIAITIAATGSVSTGTARIAAEDTGFWNIQLGPGGITTSIVLTDNALNPMERWTARRSIAGQVTASYQLRSGIEGDAVLDDHVVKATLEPGAWSESFTWSAAPVAAGIARSASDTRRWVQYADGTSTFVIADYHAETWSWTGPGLQSAVGHYQSGRWTLTADYQPEQAYRQITTVIERTPAIGTLESVAITEQRVTRLGARNEINITGAVENGLLRLQWQESDILSGTVVISPSQLGWQIEGFWDTVFGDLLELDIEATTLGYWRGQFAGWRAEDTENPTESGEWVMLPDGLFEATVLFKQADESLATLPIISPPEGASRRALED